MIVTLLLLSFISWLLETDTSTKKKKKKFNLKTVSLLLSLKVFKCKHPWCILILMSVAKLAVGNFACSLHDSVALSEVSPPHMLVGDLDDICCREPALLTVREAAAFIPACKTDKEEEGRAGRKENKQRQLEVLVSFMQENRNKSINCYSGGLRIDTVMRIRVYKQAESREGVNETRSCQYQYIWLFFLFKSETCLYHILYLLNLDPQRVIVLNGKN